MAHENLRLNPTLELSPEEMRAFGDEVLDTILGHFEGLSQRPVVTPVETNQVRPYLREPIPHAGMEPRDALQQVCDHALNYMMHTDHPRFFSFVPSASNFIGAMADALASSFNVFSGGWLGPSGIAEIELTTIDWLRQMFDFPESSGGLFVSGGSMANMTALAVARQVKLHNNVTNATIYFCDQTHSSVEKDLKILGFQTYQLRKIPAARETLALSMQALQAQMDSDRARGMNPFCVVANAGTTNTGAVDPLPELGGVLSA